jgi:hypothetical protein
MNYFTNALQEKIDELESDKDVIDAKIGLLLELLEAEGGKSSSTSPAPKRRSGRPKGSKNKKIPKKASTKHAPKDDLYDEAMKQVAKLEEGGTSAELQRSRISSFNPTPRPVPAKPPNVHAGTKDAVNQSRLAAGKVDAQVSVDEDDLADDQ